MAAISEIADAIKKQVVLTNAEVKALDTALGKLSDATNVESDGMAKHVSALEGKGIELNKDQLQALRDSMGDKDYGDLNGSVRFSHNCVTHVTRLINALI